MVARAAWLVHDPNQPLFFKYGRLFHWFSKMQKSVSLSSAEAEYFGAMMLAREIMFIRELLVELNETPSGPSVIFSDSASAVDMSNVRSGCIQEHQAHHA